MKNLSKNFVNYLKKIELDDEICITCFKDINYCECVIRYIRKEKNAKKRQSYSQIQKNNV